MCIKIELFQGGNLALDRLNSDCTAENESSSQLILSSFQSITDKISFVGQVWSGHFNILEDPTMTGIETKLLGTTVSGNMRIFGAELKIPTCIAPSSVPSSIPSVLSCNVENPNWIGYGFYDDNFPGYYTKGCDWDGGDCDALKEKYPLCPGPLAFLGDCECDEHLNIAQSGFDDGDCLQGCSGKFRDGKLETYKNQN